MTLTIDLVPHMDAGDRTQWRQNQDERPLSALGLATWLRAEAQPATDKH